MINSEIRKEDRLCWFVMRCRETEKIEALIEEYNGDENVPSEKKIEDFFIPSLVISQRINLVFLYVRPSAFDQREGSFSTRYWNSGGTRLSFYNDGKGEAITVRPDMMSVFINGCLEYHERFEIGLRDNEIVDGIEVTVRRGAFKDFKAEVYDVRYRAHGVRFSIAIRFFANERYVHIHDLCPDDVQLEDRESPVFSDDFIDRVQTSLLEILRRRVNNKETEETREADRWQLRQLYNLRHAAIDDALHAAQFEALMSICVSLMGNSREKNKYNRIIKQRIKELRTSSPSGEGRGVDDSMVAEAYLLTALYISTKDAEYRTELKTLVMQHLPGHKPLRAFLALVRK